MRSVMKNPGTSSPRQEERKKPVISFGKVEHKFKPLENRPVMQLPPEERRPPRRDGRAPLPSGTPTSTHEKRLRDDVKPMFQRDIGFATPSRDGTAKK